MSDGLNLGAGLPGIGVKFVELEMRMLTLSEVVFLKRADKLWKLLLNLLTNLTLKGETGTRLPLTKMDTLYMPSRGRVKVALQYGSADAFGTVD